MTIIATLCLYVTLSGLGCPPGGWRGSSVVVIGLGCGQEAACPDRGVAAEPRQYSACHQDRAGPPGHGDIADAGALGGTDRGDRQAGRGGCAQGQPGGGGGALRR